RRWYLGEHLLQAGIRQRRGRTKARLQKGQSRRFQFISVGVVAPAIPASHASRLPIQAQGNRPRSKSVMVASRPASGWTNHASAGVNVRLPLIAINGRATASTLHCRRSIGERQEYGTGMSGG